MLASPFSATDFFPLLKVYELYAATEGHSPHSIILVRRAVRYFSAFCEKQALSKDVRQVTPFQLRAYILYLKTCPCFANHPFAKQQPYCLSGNTINTYLRTLRIFFSWLYEEGVIEAHPFERLKIPKAPKKIVQTFSEENVRAVLQEINTESTTGFRDFTIILMLLDTGLRLAELTGLCISDLFLEQGIARVMGKGQKQRTVPLGRQLIGYLWRYISFYRPAPLMPKNDRVFLTEQGQPLKKNRVQFIVKHHGLKAGITGVRLSPHTFRHTAAVTFLRNGGDVFTLQRMLGHSSLEMTRHYCQVADVDVKRAHITASPVDNLGIASPHRAAPRRRQEKRRR